MASTYDFTDTTKAYVASAPEVTLEDNRYVVFRNVIDFAEQNLAAGQSATVLDIPANTLVVQAGIRCITADANANYNLGDLGTDNRWFNETTAGDSANAVVMSASGTNAVFYTAANGLVITSVANGVDTLKVEVFMVALPSAIDDNVKKPMQN
jgi:hypothetical protein